VNKWHWDSEWKLLILGFIIVILMLLLSPILLWGSEDDDCRQGHFQCGHDFGDTGDVDANANANANADADANASASASAIGEGGAGGEGGDAFAKGGAGGEGGTGGEGGAGGGGDASITFAKRAPTNFLYMQNQVEACGRTFGFSGSNTSGGWAFGIPIPRSWTPTCDLWKAAEEAQQNGFIFTSYMFQCNIKAVWNVLGEDTCEKFERMSLVEMGMLEEPPDLTEIYDRAARYDGRWLLAEVTEEEYIEQQQFIEDKFAQYDNLIEEQQKEHESDDAEITRLKEEAAVQEVELKKGDARRAAARAVLDKEKS